MGKVWKLPPRPKLEVKKPTIDLQSGGQGSDVFFQVAGVKSLQETLLNLGDVARKAAGIELSQIGRDILDYSKEYFVPYLLGDLHDSGDSDEFHPEAMTNVKIAEIAIWYGGPPDPESGISGTTGVAIPENTTVRDPRKYARRQHEELHEHYTKPGTGWKYLEIPFMKFQPSIERRIAKAVATALNLDQEEVIFHPFE